MKADNRFKALRHRLMSEGPKRMAREKKERDLAASDKRFEARKAEAVALAREVAVFGERSIVKAEFDPLEEKAGIHVKTRTIYTSTSKIEQVFDDGKLVSESCEPLNK